MKNIKSACMSIVLLIAIIFSSCVLDWKEEIAVIKNNSQSRILIAKQPTQIMTDSILYNERFDEQWIDANKNQTFSLPNTKLSSKPDFEKTYLYVFNCDSVDKYQALKKVQGIIEHSFIKRIEIQLNKVKSPLDTIYIK